MERSEHRTDIGKACGIGKHLRLEVRGVKAAAYGQRENVDDLVAQEQIKTLNRLGVEVALDDFGTGHTAMAYLRDLPAQRLKLDRQFVQGLPGDRHNRAICNAMITLGHELGMCVLAEGVENQAEMAALRDMGCDEFQGFLLARPQASQDIVLPEATTSPRPSTDTSGCARLKID